MITPAKLQSRFIPSLQQVVLARAARVFSFIYAGEAVFLILLAWLGGLSSRSGRNPLPQVVGMVLLSLMIASGLHQCGRFARSRPLGPLTKPLLWAFVLLTGALGALLCIHFLKIVMAVFLLRFATPHHAG
jgi:hypothetical protein